MDDDPDEDKDETVPDAVLFGNKKPEDDAELKDVGNEITDSGAELETVVDDAMGNENPGAEPAEVEALGNENAGAEEAELEAVVGNENADAAEVELEYPNEF